MANLRLALDVVSVIAAFVTVAIVYRIRALKIAKVRRIVRDELRCIQLERAGSTVVRIAPEKKP